MDNDTYRRLVLHGIYCIIMYVSGRWKTPGRADDWIKAAIIDEDWNKK